MPTIRPSACVAGEEALARGAWTEARDVFERALTSGVSAEALEGLAQAAWWLDDAACVFNARERAYRLYLTQGDCAGAARIAVWLAWDYWAFRGENAVANGWLQRARRLLESQPECAERAWLELREAAICLQEEGDTERAGALAMEGMRIARCVGDINFEMLGRAVLGLSQITAGSVAEGMRNLDEVNTAVIAGELTDLVVIGLASCYMIAACERVRDCDRAMQWCKRLRAFAAQWGLRPLFAVCRTQYASICVWRGTWIEAEQELRAASEELAASRPAMSGDALGRLADLRRRQGRLVEASELFGRARISGIARLGCAELALDNGDARAAAEQAERCLRHLPAQNRTDRAVALELLVRAFADAGQLERARAALAELTGLVASVGTVALRAATSFASGCVALSEGKSDSARQAFEDSVDLFLQSGAPFEVARARTGLARALSQLGRTDTAIEEAGCAIALFTELHAEVESARAKSVLDALMQANPKQSEATPSSSDGTSLTRREIEVLRLVAEGLSNQTIAERLFVSDHTVHRHLANILCKMSVSTRAAAVAQAVRRGVLS